MLIDKDSYKFIHISCLFVGLSSNLLGYPSLTDQIDQPWLALTSKTPSRQMRLYSAWQPLAKAWSSFSSPPSISCNHGHRMASAFRDVQSNQFKNWSRENWQVEIQKTGPKLILYYWSIGTCDFPEVPQFMAINAFQITKVWDSRAG